MLQADYIRRERQDVPPCPNCHNPVPVGENTPSAYMFTVRKGGQDIRCLKRDCYCGQELTIDKSGEDTWCYSFRCRGCRKYVASLFPKRYCTHCELEQVVGVKDAATLVVGLAESDVFIPASRDDTLNGLLKGLLTGAPGLTVAESPDYPSRRTGFSLPDSQAA